MVPRLGRTLAERFHRDARQVKGNVADGNELTVFLWPTFLVHRVPVRRLDGIRTCPQTPYLSALPCIGRGDFRFAVFGKQVVERFSKKALNGAVILDGEQLKLLLHGRREIGRYLAFAGSA